MKKGLPNILPLPTSYQKPSQVFRQCTCSFALRFGKHIQVAYTWTGVEFAWLSTQDGAGGFEFAGNAFPIDPKDNDGEIKEAYTDSRSRRVSDVLDQLLSMEEY